MPLSLSTEPLSTPAGIFTVVVSVLRVLPAPPQFGHIFVTFLPVPPQAEHVRDILKNPFEVSCLPEPLHEGHVVLASAPLPPHFLQLTSLESVMRLVVPEKASSSDTSRLAMRSAPRKTSGPRLMPGPKKSVNMSPKPKSNPSSNRVPAPPAPHQGPPSNGGIVPKRSYSSLFFGSPSTA